MSACGQAAKQEPIVSASTELHQVDLVSAGTLVFDLASVPAYSGQPYAIVNDNKPYFTDADLTAVSFETYIDLDSLGRCGVAYASVGKDLMQKSNVTSCIKKTRKKTRKKKSKKICF